MRCLLLIAVLLLAVQHELIQGLRTSKYIYSTQFVRKKSSFVLRSVVNTYKQVECFIPTWKKKRSFLVQEGNVDVINTLAEESDTKDEELINQWIKDKVIFPSSLNSIHLSKVLKNDESLEPVKLSTLKRNRRRFSTIDTYIPYKYKGETFLVKSLRYSDISRIGLQKLVSSGDAYRNVTTLINNENINKRAQNIVNKITEYPAKSVQYLKWVDKYAAYNRVTLLQALTAWQSQYTIADLAKEGNYIPTKGSIATNPPSANFKDNCDTSDIKAIIHPWPACQEFRPIVRWVSPHPPSYPVLVWAALSGLFHEEDVYREIMVARARGDDIIIGPSSSSSDALRIAFFSNMGNFYDPDIQQPFGGYHSTFKHDIPHYNTELPATVSPFDIDYSEPAHIRDRNGVTFDTNLFKDPDDHLTLPQLEEIYDEEEVRKERLMEMLGIVDESQLTEVERMAREDQYAGSILDNDRDGLTNLQYLRKQAERIGMVNLALLIQEKDSTIELFQELSTLPNRGVNLDDDKVALGGRKINNVQKFIRNKKMLKMGNKTFEDNTSMSDLDDLSEYPINDFGASEEMMRRKFGYLYNNTDNNSTDDDCIPFTAEDEEEFMLKYALDIDEEEALSMTPEMIQERKYEMYRNSSLFKTLDTYLPYDYDSGYEEIRKIAPLKIQMDFKQREIFQSLFNLQRIADITSGRVRATKEVMEYGIETVHQVALRNELLRRARKYEPSLVKKAESRRFRGRKRRARAEFKLTKAGTVIRARPKKEVVLRPRVKAKRNSTPDLIDGDDANLPEMDENKPIKAVRASKPVKVERVKVERVKAVKAIKAVVPDVPDLIDETDADLPDMEEIEPMKDDADNDFPNMNETD